MQTLINPLLGLDTDFPSQIYLVFHPATKRYGCYRHQGIHGLASFSSVAKAVEFGKQIELNGLSIVQMTFDEARDVAKERPMPVTALMLLDNMSDPKIHFIR
jgi:hypothetical protein